MLASLSSVPRDFYRYPTEMMLMRFTILLLASIFTASQSDATDRSFDDLVISSQSGEWRLEAKSPDNRFAGYHAWQDEFVYTMFKSDEQVWQRKQDDQSPEEGSPINLTVADDGWVAIRDGLDQLIFVDPLGQNSSRIVDLNKCLSVEDKREFTTWSSGGLIWAPFSLWHFIDFDHRPLFVIRLWWGQHLVFDPRTGERVGPTPAIREAIRSFQVDHCRTELLLAVADGVDDNNVERIMTAAYLAGRLRINETVDHLKEMEKSERVGSYGGAIGTELADGEIDPFFIQQFSLRQVAQLSLRRLGVAPALLPVFEFGQGGSSELFRPRPRTMPTDSSLLKIKLGMTPREVLDILGSPDLVNYPEWSFDLDGEDSKTVTVSWDSGTVKEIKTTPPLWKAGLSRDKLIVRF